MDAGNKLNALLLVIVTALGCVLAWKIAPLLSTSFLEAGCP